jgi:tRNA-Thr(GGU) m(6)t(6)A37 methyltransferase TsaA
MTELAAYSLKPIAFVRSALRRLEDAPRQGSEGAPAAWLDVQPALLEAFEDLQVGDELFLITWFHEARRDVLTTHPRGDASLPLTGVFATRSPDRPNPLGLHRVTLISRDGCQLQVEPLEAIDGTPVVDIKPVLASEW